MATELELLKNLTLQEEDTEEDVDDDGIDEGSDDDSDDEDEEEEMEGMLYENISQDSGDSEESYE